MEKVSRLLFCCLFIVNLHGYATGAKKKKDLETIVEVGPMKPIFS